MGAISPDKTALRMSSRDLGAYQIALQRKRQEAHG